jgi:hypothetical protein
MLQDMAEMTGMGNPPAKKEEKMVEMELDTDVSQRYHLRGDTGGNVDDNQNSYFTIIFCRHSIEEAPPLMSIIVHIPTHLGANATIPKLVHRSIPISLGRTVAVSARALCKRRWWRRWWWW